MGLLDMLGAAPGSPQAMQLQGLLGGLISSGGALAQAGQFRPVGAPAPSVADAIGAFGTGRRSAMANAFQSAQMEKQQKRAGLLAEARDTSKPDESISPEARAIRAALSGLGPDIAALADDDQLPGLAIQRATSRQRPMTPEELKAAGFRPGTVAFTNDFTGGASVGQQPDTMSDAAFAQKARLSAMNRAPTVTWRDERDASGNIIGQRSTTGEFRPINAPAMNPGQAVNVIATLGPRVADGTIKPGTPDFERYTMAYAVADEVKTEYVPDPRNPGMLMPTSRPRMRIPPQFPNPATILAPQGQPAPQPAPEAAPAPAPAPASAPMPAPHSAPIGTTGLTASPPQQITPDMARRLQSGEEEAFKLQDAVDNYMTSLRRHGTGLGTLLNNPRSPEAQEVLGAFERVKMVMRSESLLNTGVLQPGEMKMLEDMLLDPRTIRGSLATPDAVEARLNQFTTQARDFYNVRRAQAGLPSIESLRRAQTGGGGTSSGGAGGGWSIRPVR